MTCPLSYDNFRTMNKGVFDFVTEFPLAAVVICGLLVLVATLIYKLSKKDMSLLESKFSALSKEVESRFGILESKFSALSKEVESRFGILESKFSALSKEVESAFEVIQKDISRIDERLNDHIKDTDKKIDELKTGQARLDSKMDKILDKIK